MLSDSLSLTKTLESVHGMIVRVQKYVQESAEMGVGDGEVGRELMEILALAPRVDVAELERMFNSHLQDVLMTVYLSNLVRSQFDVANRLTLVVT